MTDETDFTSITAYFPKKIAAQLKQIAKLERRSVSAQLTKIVEEYLTKK